MCLRSLRGGSRAFYNSCRSRATVSARDNCPTLAYYRNSAASGLDVDGARYCHLSENILSRDKRRPYTLRIPTSTYFHRKMKSISPDSCACRLFSLLFVHPVIFHCCIDDDDDHSAQARDGLLDFSRPSSMAKRWAKTRTPTWAQRFQRSAKHV